MREYVKLLKSEKEKENRFMQVKFHRFSLWLDFLHWLFDRGILLPYNSKEPEEYFMLEAKYRLSVLSNNLLNRSSFIPDYQKYDEHLRSKNPKCLPRVRRCE
jgi:hypothetical protein